MAKRVIFIRPGETDWNKLGRWQGQIAIPLNDQGRAQAERLALFLRPIGLDALYSSDLFRARETTEMIAQKTGIKPIYDPRLRERHMGEWQGLTQEDVTAWYAQEYARFRADPETYQIPGGESRRQVAQRARAAFDDAVARGGETIALVSHSVAIRSLLRHLVPESDAYMMTFKNMSVTTIALEDDKWKITQLDDVTHLEGMPSFEIREPEDHRKA